MHVTNLLVADLTIRGVARIRRSFELEIEAHRQARPDLAAQTVVGIIEAHAEGLDTDRPVLHRYLAHGLAPQRLPARASSAELGGIGTS